jgi:hypothetical protein
MIVRDRHDNVTGIVVMHDHGRALNYERIVHRPRTSRLGVAAAWVLIAIVSLALVVCCAAVAGS